MSRNHITYSVSYHCVFLLDLHYLVWPWLQKKLKSVPGCPILTFSGLGYRSRQNESHGVRFVHFLALASEVEKMRSRRSDSNIFWHWPRSRQNAFQEIPSKHFLAVAAESREQKERAQSREQREQSREQGAESREQRAEGRVKRAEGREQRADSSEQRSREANRREQRAGSREQRADSRGQDHSGQP